MTVRIVDPPASIFKTSASAVIVPVNTIGTCGAGLARVAARVWPEWAMEYKADCAARRVIPGGIRATRRTASCPAFVISAATKDHWRDPSRIAWVEACLVNLATWTTGARSLLGNGVGVPALGCGCGNLPWLGDGGVRALSERILGAVAGVDFLLFAPHDEARR